MEKKYQVFISSTYKDLIEEREKVRDVILSMYHFPIGMEMFNAADEEQWEIIRETIDSSDYYVLIIGKRYGSVIPEGRPDAGLSYTEKEYRYAVEKGIPVLTFIKKDSAVTADKMDSDSEKVAKLDAFVKDITSSKEADWFSNVDELGTKVSLALHKQMDRKRRPGWVRGDRFDLEASMNELVNLNQRVRGLEEENKKLKESVINRVPSLIVGIQYAGTVETPLIPDEENTFDNADDNTIESTLSTSEIVDIHEIPEDSYFEAINPISIQDVPNEVKEQVTSEIIEEYNSALPQKEVIEEYNKSMYYYNEIQKNGQLLNFFISNNGTAKATDINITLDFPKSFILMKRKEAEGFSKPKKPTIPQNPIKKALAQKTLMGKAEQSLNSILSAISEKYAYNSFGDSSSLDIERALIDRDFSVGWSVEIEGSKVKIWSNSLLHTYSQVAKELCIIPTKKGVFEIKVIAMCEEYLHPEETKLELTVN